MLPADAASVVDLFFLSLILSVDFDVDCSAVHRRLLALLDFIYVLLRCSPMHTLLFWFRLVLYLHSYEYLLIVYTTICFILQLLSVSVLYVLEKVESSPANLVNPWRRNSEDCFALFLKSCKSNWFMFICNPRYEPDGCSPFELVHVQLQSSL